MYLVKYSTHDSDYEFYERTCFVTRYKNVAEKYIEKGNRVSKKLIDFYHSLKWFSNEVEYEGNEEDYLIRDNKSDNNLRRYFYHEIEER